MTSSATRGLLAGVGQGLAMAGEMGLKDHYESLRQKKAQEYKLEGMSVQNEYATESQNRSFAHDETMTATAQENAQGLLNTKNENTAALTQKEIDARADADQAQREFTAQENAKDRTSREAIAGSKTKPSTAQTEYLKNTLKNKYSQLNKILEANFGKASEQSDAIAQEIRSLEAQYSQAAGVTVQQTPNGQHKSSSGITFTVE